MYTFCKTPDDNKNKTPLFTKIYSCSYRQQSNKAI